VLTVSTSVSVRVASSLNRLHRRKSKKALQTSAFFVSALFSVSFAHADCPWLPGGFEAEVVEVYDGDTVRLRDGQRVRLIGIDTPELGRNGAPDQPGARAAKRWLEQHVLEQRVYLLPGAEPRDRYNRTLAHLYRQDRLVSEQMVRRGLGFALAVGANTRLADCLFSAEGSSRARSLGVWQRAPRAAGAIEKPGFAIIRGHISRMTPTRSGLYLDVDDHLALFLPARLASGVEGLRMGTQVEARGWVQDRLERQSRLRPGQQRWLLRITAPQHLQTN